MKHFLSLCSLTIMLTAPAVAQDAGTPPATNGAPENRPLTQRFLVFPPKSSGTGTLRADGPRPQPGRPVTLTFTITNATRQTVNYDYPTAQQFDVTVSDPQDRLVWDWAQGRAFARTITRTSLKPGDQKTYRVTWDGRDAQGRPVAPGLYTVSARMTSSDRPGITGGFLVDPDTDPNNIGFPTRSPAENGAVRQFTVNPPITATMTLAVGVPGPSDAK